MHYLVRLIVEADTVEEANIQADSVMMDLVEWHEFDWYTMQDMESRWDDCWKPIRLATKKAQAMVQETMQEQRTVFDELMATIRFMMSHYNDEQIFNEEFKQEMPGRYLSRYQFSKASVYNADACQLYDTNGNAITNQRDLDAYLKEPKRLWVVQVDCHN